MQIALLLFLALLAACARTLPPRVIDDFESGTLGRWRSEASGSGGWHIYRDGHTPPDAAQSDPHFPFAMPNPPQGTFAAVTDMRGPGRRVLYADVTLDARYALDATIFYAGAGAPGAESRLQPGQAFRVDVMRPSASVDSVEEADILGTAFQTSVDSPVTCDPMKIWLDLSPWTGTTVRLRVLNTDEGGPLRAGIDDVRLTPLGSRSTRPSLQPLCASSPRRTPQPSASPREASVERLEEAAAIAATSAHAEALARADRFSGVLLIAREGKVLFRRGWGLANRETGEAITPDTKFRIGSMNKMLTSVAIMRLARAHRLSLDDALITHLPDYPNQDLARQVTIRHLLTHTGATGDIFGPEFERNRDRLREHADYLALYGQRPLAERPGKVHRYSNYGFVLLGAVIERVSGMRYDDFMRTQVFAPTGMRATGALPESEPVKARAVGYRRVGDAWVSNADVLPWRGTSAGGGYSTVDDLSKFAEALIANQLVDRAQLDEATRPQSPGVGYGLGFAVFGEGPLMNFGHAGGAPGINGDLHIFPNLGYVVVCLSNLDPPAASDVLQYFVSRMPISR